MTDRDTFAAAALTGLTACGDYSVESTPVLAYRMADAMLRQRANHIPDAGKMVETPRTPQSDRLAEWERHGSHRWGLGVASDLYDLECRVAALEKAIHDAAPAARASEATASPERVRVRGNAGTGDTFVPDAYRRFVGEVMEWISEATSIYEPRSDGGRLIMADACCRCWDAFDRIAYPDHDAAPAAIASVESVGTDKAEPLPNVGRAGNPPSWDGTGDAQAPVAWAVVCPNGEVAVIAFKLQDAEERATASDRIVPLYRSPTLTDNEVEAVELCIFQQAVPQKTAVTMRRMLERLK